MAIPLIISSIISSLVASNLPKVAQAVADKGLEYVEDKLGLKLEPTMSAEKVAEIQIAAQKHEEFKIEQAYKDTADARDMQKVALQQNDLFSKRFVYYLAIGWSLFTALYIIGITFAGIPPESVRFADTILGFLLGTIVATIMNFFFGSSQSSKDKTQELVKAVQGG
jgi:hypothetical protein